MVNIDAELSLRFCSLTKPTVKPGRDCDDKTVIKQYLTALYLQTDALCFLKNLFDVQFHRKLINVLKQKDTCPFSLDWKVHTAEV